MPTRQAEPATPRRQERAPLVLAVARQTPALPPLKLSVLGGYRKGPRVMLLVQCAPELGSARSLVALIGIRAVRFKNHARDEALPEAEWSRFRYAPTGRRLGIGGTY